MTHHEGPETTAEEAREHSPAFLRKAAKKAGRKHHRKGHKRGRRK